MKLASILFLLAAYGTCCAQQAPSSDDILRTARFVATLQQQDLLGHIRKDRLKVPVGLYLRGENIQFSYTKPQVNQDVRFHMRLEDDHYSLFEVGGDGKTARFPDAKLGQAIEGTDLSYEDLSMRFLYWPNGQVLGTEKVKGQDCWKVWLQNPGKAGRYGYVYVWVHQKSGALMQVVGYDKNKRPLKRFQITDIMRVGEVYTIRRMRVDSMDPAANKVIGITYLEFDKPKAAEPGRLR